MQYFKQILFFIPLIIFISISITFFFALKYNNVEELPSNLIQKSAPKLDLIRLGYKELPSNADLRLPEIKFVNFWASWCAPCRAEHSILKEITDLNYTVIGINYKDDPKSALQFLEELGDPYLKVGADISGRNGLDWGLYGVPETFVINRNGKIILRHAGPITTTIFEEKFKPLLRENL